MRSDGRKSEALPVVRKFENHRVNIREQSSATFSDPHHIARAELVRFRRRLGTLTSDQELQIENLLISTVTKISLMTGPLLKSLGPRILQEEGATAIESKYVGSYAPQ